MTQLTDDDDEGSSRVFDVARELIAARFAVFPAAVWTKDDGTVGKAPLTRNGHLDAHTDLQLIFQQLGAPPHCPPGVPREHEVVVAFLPGSGDCGVLDCDVKHGKGGKQALAELDRQYGSEWIKAAWQTPSGGLNILFRKPLLAAFSNRSPWAGIDVRADNGWVVAPGNVCAAGAWRWKVGTTFTDAVDLPGAMSDQLTAADTHQPRASNREAREFIEESPSSSSPAALDRFKDQLAEFGQSTQGSRHDAMVKVLGWAFGMGSLDLRLAVEWIKDAWLLLTAGEGREDEVTEAVTWVVAQERAKRAAKLSGQASVTAGSPAAAPGLAGATATPQDDPFIDWRAFALRNATINDWLIEDFWPRGRAMALWADAKEGKSELALWCAICLATGVHPWTGTTVAPVEVAYLDYEMTEDDLEERLDYFEADPLDLEHLHYLLLPALSPLDGRIGGEELLALVARCRADVVIIDTFGRAVIGEEDRADTVNAFYRYTGSRLKAGGVSYLRTDHAGKDRSRGQRGSSAKRGDVDVIWQQRRTQAGALLDCTGSSRLSWVGPKLAVDRVVDPHTGIVRYSAPITIGGWPAGTAAKAAELDSINLPLDAGRPSARAALKAAGILPGRNGVLTAALQFRRDRATVPKGAGTASASSPIVPNQGQSGTVADDDLFSPPEQDES